MNTDMNERIDVAMMNRITQLIIGCAYKISNALGSEFLEKVYENALVHELKKAGLSVLQQHRVEVIYDGVVVGEYVADLIVEGLVAVEIKAIKALEEIHSAQCINYLAATTLPVCLLINFAPKVQIRRLVRKGISLDLPA